MSESLANTTEKKKAAGISFKLQGSSKGIQSATVRPTKTLLTGEARDDTSDKKDYLLSVEGNRLQTVIPTPAARELIIPLIKKNQWRIQKQQPHSVGKRGKEEEVGVTSHEDNEAAKEILKDIQAGKFSSSNKTGGVEGGGGEGTDGPVIPLLMQNKPPVETSDDKLNDLELRPDVSSMDDYTDMPITEFGAAMLKGMGWKPGEAIGLNKKGLLEPIEFIPHPGGLGLGATMKPPERKKNKIKKPGEVEKKRAMPYMDKDGRVKHIKKIGEEIPQQTPKGYHPGNYGQVKEGPHAGLYGKIVTVDKERARVVLELVINKQEIKFSQSNIELVSKEQSTSNSAPNESSRQPSKQYGLIIPGQQPKSQQDSAKPTSSKELTRSGYKDRHDDDRSDRRRDERKREERGREERGRDERGRDERGRESHKHKYEREDERERIKRNDRREQSERNEDRKRQRTIEEQTTSTDKRPKREERVTMEETDHPTRREGNKIGRTHVHLINKEAPMTGRRREEECWLRSQLRVRIVDQRYRKGRYYNKKVVIVDVIDPTTCICQTEEGKLMEGISLNMLETVVPKTIESIIMIVKGQYKGQLAMIVEKNSSKCTTVVQLLQTKEVLSLDYDFICDYIGDTNI